VEVEHGGNGSSPVDQRTAEGGQYARGRGLIYPRNRRMDVAAWVAAHACGEWDSHIRPTTVVVNLKDIAHLIHASLPLWVRLVLDRVQGDGCAHSSS
jgi:hypothetical protein